jgi:hypothetical protein
MTTPETTDDEPRDITGRPAKHDGAHRGRRISWQEFYRQRPDLRPANDDITPQLGAAARRQELSPNHRSSS